MQSLIIGNYSAALHLHAISLSYIVLVCEVYARSMGASLIEHS